MNILAISNLYNTNLIKSKETNQNANYTTLTMAKPLLKDTVSFRAKKATIADAITAQAQHDIDRMRRLAKNIVDSLAGVADELESFGVTFNRAYGSSNSVKDPNKYVSKIIRSGQIVIPDKIRSTLFCKNLSDLNILFNHILPALQERGLVVAKTTGNIDDLIKKGYVPKPKELVKNEVIVPDLDIRLANVAEQAESLDSLYKYCISKPQKSGYSDIQIRLVRNHDPNKKNPVLYELILLRGQNHAYAKHLESDFVYSLTRQYDELNIVKKGNNNIESCQTAKRCIELIKRILTAEISQKLYSNAEMLDTHLSGELAEIKINSETKRLIQQCFNELDKSLKYYYATAAASPRIAPTTKKKIEVLAKSDIEKISDLRKKLEKSIKFFNEKNYLDRREEYWPKLFNENFTN